MPDIKQKPAGRPPCGPDKQPRIPTQYIKTSAVFVETQAREPQQDSPGEYATDTVTRAGEQAGNSILQYGQQEARQLRRKAVQHAQQPSASKVWTRTSDPAEPCGSSPMQEEHTPPKIKQRTDPAIREKLPEMERRGWPSPEQGKPTAQRGSNSPELNISKIKTGKSVASDSAAAQNSPSPEQWTRRTPPRSNAPEIKQGVSHVKGVESVNPDMGGGSRSMERGRQLARRRFQKTRPSRAMERSGRKAAETAVKGGTNSIKTVKRTIKGTERAARAAAKGTKMAVKTTEQAAKAAAKTAKATAKASARAVQTAAKVGVKTVQLTAKAIVALVKATIAAVKGLVSLIAAGGWIAVVIIVIIAVLAFIVASPVSILVGSGSSQDGEPGTAEVVRILKKEHALRVNDAGSGSSADRTSHSGSVDWAAVLAVYAVKIGLDPERMEDLTLWDDSKIQKLREVYRDMVSIDTHTTEQIHIEGEGEDAVEVTVTTLNVDTECKSGASMIGEYGFNKEQAAILRDLLSPDYTPLWAELLGG